MWLLGATVAACGTAVYVELGTVSFEIPSSSSSINLTVQGIPRNGGEKNYLEFLYRRPRFLATCIYGTYAIFGVRSLSNVNVDGLTVTFICDFQGFQAAGCTIFGECRLPSIMSPRCALQFELF